MRAGRKKRRSGGILVEALRSLRTGLIRDAVIHQGNVHKAAQVLGISCRTVRRHMKGA